MTDLQLLLTYVGIGIALCSVAMTFAPKEDHRAIALSIVTWPLDILPLLLVSIVAVPYGISWCIARFFRMFRRRPGGNTNANTKFDFG